jgi:hypothetical protein
MFDKAKEEFGASAGGKISAHVVDVAAESVSKRVFVTQLHVDSLLSKKKELMKWVQTDANRPQIRHAEIVASVACEGLRRDYMRMCTNYDGGLQIVYDDKGKGNSCALQAVARAEWFTQPDRFLVINIQGSRSCQELYQAIKDRVLGVM